MAEEDHSAEIGRAKRKRQQVNYKDTGRKLREETLDLKEAVKAESEAAAVKDLGSGPFRQTFKSWIMTLWQKPASCCFHCS